MVAADPRAAGAVPTQQRSARPSRRSPEPPLPTSPVSLDGAALQGNQNARVALIEYSDFQCPFCGKFAREVLPDLQEKYVRSGRILLAFRHFPLPMHPFAHKAAEASECAGRQGRFWPMHDLLFRDAAALDRSRFDASAQALGVDMKRFAECLEGQAAQRVERDAAGGRALLVSATPTFFAGTLEPGGLVKVTQRLTGAMPLAQFETALDALLVPPK